MSHAIVENHSPFAFEPLYLVDEELRPLIVPIVKATFTIGKDGRLARAEEQVQLNTGGEYWGKNPETSSFKYEPEVAFTKPATDVVLIGHAYAPNRGTTEMRVSLSVGPVTKEAVVFGDRLGSKTAGFFTTTRPAPFERIPLIYERAFGGWDRSHADPAKHTYEPRNPVGTGFTSPDAAVKELRLPNIEDPRAPFKSLGDRPAPMGFGFVAPHWQPRAALAGTYDEAWQKGRSPLLARDFDRKHLNAASPGLVTQSHLRGDEPVSAVGMTPEGKWSFSLPGVPPPKVRVALVDGADQEIALALDTVIIEPDDRRVMLIWRGALILRTGPHDVGTVVVLGETVPR